MPQKSPPSSSSKSRASSNPLMRMTCPPTPVGKALLGSEKEGLVVLRASLSCQVNDSLRPTLDMEGSQSRAFVGGEPLQGFDKAAARNPQGFSDASAMTWRSAANKICASSPWPYGNLTPETSLPNKPREVAKSLKTSRFS